MKKLELFIFKTAYQIDNLKFDSLLKKKLLLLWGIYFCFIVSLILLLT